MELRRELVTSIGALVIALVLVAFGSIGLFARMGPAIEQILDENVYSIVAAEEILASFALAGDAPLDQLARQRVAAAVSNARQNVTEDSEIPVLDSLERDLARAADGEVEARIQVVTDVEELMRINRLAMNRVDSEARRLGSAGAWAAVVIGLASFLLGVVLINRLQKRVLRPLLDVHEVLEAYSTGRTHRRCRRTDAPEEVRRLAESVNRLLDERG